MLLNIYEKQRTAINVLTNIHLQVAQRWKASLKTDKFPYGSHQMVVTYIPNNKGPGMD